MTDEEAKQQLEKVLRERLEGLRQTFARSTQKLAISDEPAPVFIPFTDLRES
jgi:hypothetical protein